MLTAVPKSWFSWDYTVMDGAQPVGDLDMSCWREKGVLTVEGTDYRVYRDGVMVRRARHSELRLAANNGCAVSGAGPLLRPALLFVSR